MKSGCHKTKKNIIKICYKWVNIHVKCEPGRLTKKYNFRVKFGR